MHEWNITSEHEVRTSSGVTCVAVLAFLYLLSFWVILALRHFFTVDSKTLFASLAKSKSLTSDRGTDTMANASLSSLVEQVPIYCDSQKNMLSNLSRVSASVWVWPYSDLEHNWTLLICINGDVGAGHPGVGAQVSKSYIGVSEEGQFIHSMNVS